MHRRQPGTARRRGIILLVVIVLLTLFALVGLSFVLYAESQANAARIARQAEAANRADVAPEALLAFFLNQFVYDVNDTDGVGVFSSLRGHGLARLMYGWNGSNPGSNTIPYNGVGRLHNPYPAKFADGIAVPSVFQGQDDFQYVNYTFFQALADGLEVRDPERLDARASPTTAYGTASTTANAYTGGFNPPYTYPDLNNMFLAAVQADGTVLGRSFHREWAGTGALGGTFTGFGTLNPSNPNWYIPSTAVATYPPPSGNSGTWPTTEPRLKYFVLRPRPVDQLLPGDTLPQGQLWPPTNRSNYFPPPEDAGGDVKNLIGGPGGNDSVWLDLNAPVLVGPDGKKYKALFAPLIVDLDGKINLNVHGNLRDTTNNAHRGNQGVGPWEVNLGFVLTQQANAAAEWPNLFLGNGTATGRYGADQQPGVAGSNTATAPGTIAHFYSSFDYDGANETNQYGASGRIALPAGTSAFPTFGLGYGSASNAELQKHPSTFNFFTPTGDHVFGWWDLEALLRYGDTGSAALTSELFQLCPANFANASIRRLVTTHSFDLDQPGLTPWIWDPSDNATLYTLNVGASYPTGGAKTFPPLSFRTSQYVPAGSEFRTYNSNTNAPPPSQDPKVDWRGNVGTGTFFKRLDLTRKLTDYPTPDPHSGRITDTATFGVAQSDRQNFAKDLYNVLVAATGAADPNTTAVNPQQFDAARWLAQLAVNLVDYLDSDDYMTPFNWYTDRTNPMAPVLYWVVGTELPRLVVNEAYVQQTPANVNTSTPELNDVWIELHNPFAPDATLPNYGDDNTTVVTGGFNTNGAARLLMPASGMATAYGIYQVVLTQANTQLTANGNFLGDPDAPFPPPGGGNNGNLQTLYDRANPADTSPAVVDFTELPGAVQFDLRFVGASGGAAAGDHKTGYCVLGSTQAFPMLTPTFQSRFLTYRGPGPNLGSSNPPTVLLRRLACPNLPPNDPRLAGYDATQAFNPYVTVDTMENLRLNVAGGANVASEGKKQPYAGRASQKVAQTSGMMGQPANSFFHANDNVANPFDWLVHLDRQPLSPVELLHVSAFKPHLLTQQFYAPPAGGGADRAFQHYAPWTDPAARIGRALEFLEVPDRAAGVTMGGRVPGRVNLNTVWDPQILEALCDPEGSNYYAQGDVDAIFTKLMNVRTPGWQNNKTLGATDSPFLPLSTGNVPAGDTQYPLGLNLENTLLRSDPTDNSTNKVNLRRRLFDITTAPQNHPYPQKQLLAKLLPNVTTRSNVFAVWVTVGFFEVIDDSTRPVKLGAEIRRAENRHVRHRMFALVDRSVLTSNPGPQGRFDPRANSPGTGGARVVPYFSIIQ
jgi:hypothetical protein